MKFIANHNSKSQNYSLWIQNARSKIGLLHMEMPQRMLWRSSMMEAFLIKFARCHPLTLIKNTSSWKLFSSKISYSLVKFIYQMVRSRLNEAWVILSVIVRTQNLPKNQYFLPSDTQTHVCVSIFLTPWHAHVRVVCVSGGKKR